MIQLRPNQTECAAKIVTVLNNHKCCYLAGETRSGKTLTALKSIDDFGRKSVLFITTKKAISSIQSDYNSLKPSYRITIINYESVRKVEGKFDFVVYDEAHRLSAFPKPSKRTKLIREMFFYMPCILMSGTPAVESYSQWYHQFFVSYYSPFSKWINFYRWADQFVTKRQLKLATHTINDYSNAKIDLIDEVIQPHIVMLKKPKADFARVEENIITLPMPARLRGLSKQLLKDRAIEGSDYYFIMGETPTKLQSKLHQIENGHCIVERGIDESKTIYFDYSKAEYIKERFKDKKIAILFFYKAERKILKKVFKDDITELLDEFNETNKHLMMYQGTTEGMNVSKADCLVWYNFGFSGVAYLQAKDRLTIKGRERNESYFIMYEDSLNEKIFKAVSKKEDYNSKAFIKDYGIKKTNKINKGVAR